MKTEFSNLPPQAIEIEESILASCILDNRNIEQSIDLLGPDDFYKTSNGILYRAITRMYRTQSPVDAVTLMQFLRESGEIDEVGGSVIISNLLDTPPAIDLDYNIKKICEKASLRRTIQVCNAVQKRCYTDQSNVEDVIDFFQKSANEISLYGGQGTIFGMRDLVMSAGDRYQELYESKGKISGVPTGYRVMDFLLGGLQPGLNILAARPSMGKTSLAVDITKNAASAGYGGLVFSMEQGEDELIDRIIAGEAMVNLMKFRTGRFEKEDWEKINAAKQKVYGWPIFIDPTGGLSVSEIKRRSRQYIRFNPVIKLIVIDYLQLITGPRAENRNHEIGEITRDLKSLSKELKIPILLLSQLNRALENRPNPNKRPKLSDLRDSGNIEQDADTVMFIYRPEVYNDFDKPTFEGQADIDIAKHRNGPTGMFSTKFHVNHTRFYDIEEIHKPGE